MSYHSFNQTLDRLVRLLAVTEDPWWILGSAAVYLRGHDPGHIGDIDVLLSVADAQRIMSDHGLYNQRDGGTPRYRSAYILKPNLGDMRIELLAGYEIHQDGVWTSIRPTSRNSISYNGNVVFVPSDAELISIFEQLGRAKDIVRIRSMQTR